MVKILTTKVRHLTKKVGNMQDFPETKITLVRSHDLNALQITFFRGHYLRALQITFVRGRYLSTLQITFGRGRYLSTLQITFVSGHDLNALKMITVVEPFQRFHKTIIAALILIYYKECKLYIKTGLLESRYQLTAPGLKANISQ